MKISVLVLSYNSDIDKLYLTLKSIIKQKIDDFEIVVSDDGSKDNHEQELAEYFKQNDFSNYKLVMNEQNRGTVQNILSGLKACEGEYVKPISSGDCLYAEDTLARLYDFMKADSLDYCHGLIRGYHRLEDGSIQYIPYSHPFDIEAYRKRDMDKITRNLVLYSDNTCGAGICYEKKFFIHYMNLISEVVKYEEDIFQVVAAVENRKVALFDDYIVWYEIGLGVSTNKKSKIYDLLAKDVDGLYRKLYDWHPENKYVKKRYKMLPLYNIKNLYVRTMLRFFVNPDAIRYLFSSYCQRFTGKHMNKAAAPGFLDQEAFLANAEADKTNV